MKLVTREEMRRLEKAANEAGLGYDLMMENAGHAAALAIQNRIGEKAAHILILVGPGNNGGDGLVSARYLHEWGHQVAVYTWQRNRPKDPNLAKAQGLDIPIFRADQDHEFQRLDKLLHESSILVDALLGTGAKGPLRDNLRELLCHVHQSLKTCEAKRHQSTTPLRHIGDIQESEPERPLIVAIDVPSGLNADTGEIDKIALVADMTVTFAYPKRGQFLFPGARHVGELLVADIGIDPALARNIPVKVATPESVAQMLPNRPLDAHKGTFGKVLIIAGSTNYVGAPCLASEAAYRVGVGLVTLAVAQTIYPIVAAKLTEPTFLVLPDDMGVLIPRALRPLAGRIEDYDALLVGPGLGREPTTGDFVYTLLSGHQSPRHKLVGFDVSSGKTQTPDLPERPLQLPPLVLDADGLNLLADLGKATASQEAEDHLHWWGYLPSQSVLTPHSGEMARLVGCSIQDIEADRIGMACRAAQKWGCTVVLKGAYTCVVSPTRTGSSKEKATIIPFANPALATAGTGDVLAGTVAGLLAQGLSTHDAAVCGAYLHGLAGEMASEQYDQAGLLASDLLPHLPRAIRRLRTA